MQGRPAARPARPAGRRHAIPGPPAPHLIPAFFLYQDDAGPVAGLVPAEVAERLDRTARDDAPQVSGVAPHPHMIGHAHRVMMRRGTVRITTAAAVPDHPGRRSEEMRP